MPVLVGTHHYLQRRIFVLGCSTALLFLSALWSPRVIVPQKLGMEGEPPAWQVSRWAWTSMLDSPGLFCTLQLPSESNLHTSVSFQETLKVLLFKGTYIWPQEIQHHRLHLQQLLSLYEGEQKHRHDAALGMIFSGACSTFHQGLWCDCPMLKIYCPFFHCWEVRFQ